MVTAVIEKDGEFEKKIKNVINVHVSGSLSLTSRSDPFILRLQAGVPHRVHPAFKERKALQSIRNDNSSLHRSSSLMFLLALQT